MKLSELGEKEVIKRLGSFLDVGDDAACIRHGDEYLVLTTDMLYQKTHILPGMTPEGVGRFIVSVNVSDVAAMGAKPVAFLMACGLSRGLEYDYLDRMLRAAEKQCRAYGARYVGGDTKEADALTLSGFCVGKTKRPVHRSGAKRGDIIAVTGALGAASLGVGVLLSGKRLAGDEDAVKKATTPIARVREGLVIGKYANALTDTSDSLSTCLHDLASMSGVGLKVFADQIPVSESTRKLAGKMGLSALDSALCGGGDYELVYTIPKRHYDKVKRKIDTTEIGVVGGQGVVLVSDGSESSLEKKGYEHFL
ncbi:MAG: thiamine-phosphate kinase [Candidatus Altiarchaeia archaeon]